MAWRFEGVLLPSGEGGAVLSGSRSRRRQKPSDWIKVAMPATNRSALIR